MSVKFARIGFIHCKTNCHLYINHLTRVRLLPSELTEYPPLAMKYSLKDIIPCKQNLKGPWGRAVWSCLEEFCGSKEILVNAVVGSDNSVVLYDTEV